MEQDLNIIDCPEVSVIVLSYNHSATVGRAIDSVLAMRSQCAALEIVVGDDGSTDGCYEICMDYAKRYPGVVRVMPREANMGVVKNYFRCLAACKGEFVTDCAADDCRLQGTWLVRQIAMLRENNAFVAVGSDWIERRNGKDVYSRDCEAHARWRYAVAGFDMLAGALASVGSFPVPLSAMLYRRSAVNAHDDMVCNDAFGCEDLPIVCALGAKGNFGFVDEESLLYFVGDNSISNSQSIDRLLRFYYKVLVCRLTLSCYYKVCGKDVKAAIKHGATFVAGLAFDSGNALWVDKIRNLVREWKCDMSLMARLKLYCTRYSVLWRMARCVKRLIGR